MKNFICVCLLTIVTLLTNVFTSYAVVHPAGNLDLYRTHTPQGLVLQRKHNWQPKGNGIEVLPLASGVRLCNGVSSL